MLKKDIVIALLLLCSNYVSAQIEGMEYDFYGFIRADLFYNSRKSVAPVDGNFYLFPLNEELDADGHDLNEMHNGDFICYTSRLGLNVKGLRIGNAKLSANVEVDFGGSGKEGAVLRLRKAYVACDWAKHRLLVGQTWHPLFGSVIPDMLNLSTGAPFQPFNRSPQIRYQFKVNNFKLTTAALWQVQYKSNGPSGPSADYLKHSLVPEMYVGGDWDDVNGLIVGAGADLLSICPRQNSVWNDNMYKVHERMTSISYEMHTMYRINKWFIAAKSLLASSLDHTALLGGYGVHSINPDNGQQKYTPFHHSTSWINVTYGRTWKPSFFVGYTKNLGTNQNLISEDSVYGSGLDIDTLLDTQLALSYNHNHFQVGVETSICSAWYGNIDKRDGRVNHTHVVNNYRILGLLMYYF